MILLKKMKHKNWSDNYLNHIMRNIGILSFSDQENLRTTPIAIFGTGGLGGSIVEQLVRSGCEQIVICDNDKFELSNLNRQLCTREDLGKYKVDVIENFLIKVNPEITFQKYYKVNKKNISKILENISIVVLALDDPIASILISRECLKKNIPMLESWGIPYLCAWWFTSDSLDYEKCYGLETQTMDIEEIKNSEKTLLGVKKAFLNKLIKFPGIKERYNREKGVLDNMIHGKIPLVSLAPIVRMIASYLAFEIIFSGILKIKKMILAPKIVGYDYLRMEPFEFNF